ncbi:MAG: ASCH domain-containing protein [Gemmataceae bacterium]
MTEILASVQADAGRSPRYNRIMAKQHALSLKQPWAALLVHGLKTIEVRRWPTARRGRVLIHAARVPDQRPEAWAHVPAVWLETAQLLGGIVGAGDITDCRAYRTIEAFQADQTLHLNDPSWFQPPMYGFTFTNLTVLPFRRYPGWMRFFAVEEAATEGQ